ncbi:uncharacterized protein F5891DRAFT_1039757 [Suillus fuscotomentosus]|uniref:Uncharacterized protein n=1 Tax=Suillus fuscotomentosus TaxID=1912939 RepID=A0AAD4E3P4_9AGAM|nr:uncharacterized protein F5891DRAFT_1039757 [Suillus fuscotomentosus]KAG1899125.1 hypothetical protein F5891DRAFT_1039757 [Suillus fuscotomentosus]
MPSVAAVLHFCRLCTKLDAALNGASSARYISFIKHLSPSVTISSVRHLELLYGPISNHAPGHSLNHELVRPALECIKQDRGP